MSLNQSGLRRAVGKNEQDFVPRGVRFADVAAVVIYLGLNLVGLVGEYTNLFSFYARKNPGIFFLYKTICFPAVYLISKFINLNGDTIYVWMTAQIVFMLCAFFTWLVFLFLRA